MKPCPLIFAPIFKPKIWGGRRLAGLLAKQLPGDEPIGESWEVADLEDDQSVVAAGPAKGRTLRELMDTWGVGLLGDARPFEGRFPLLIKYLDAAEHLSVQVHPDEGMARRMGGRVRVKNEAWYVVDAAPEGCIYRGLAPGVDAVAFRAALADGTCENLLQRIPVKAGQCFYLPSGTVHALGAGVVVAEVQTPSDTTYRVFDWNRIDAATGKGRDLHIEPAMECINFGDQAIVGDERSHTASVWTTVTRLVTCDWFLVERVHMIEGFDQAIPYRQLVIWMMLEGAGTIHFANGREALRFGKGDTVVLPAGLDDARLTTQADCTWLEVTLPAQVPAEAVR